MKFQLPERAFPPLVLSAQEEQSLIYEADRIVEATIAAQEAHIARGRKVQTEQWKHLRCKEGMNVYRQRSVGVSKKRFDPIAATTHVESVEPISTTPAPRSMLSFRSAETPASRRPQSAKSTSTLEDIVSMSPASSADHASHSRESEWMEYQRKPPDVPGLLAVGVVDGRLEDAMYGIFSDDDAAWRWKSSQINDKLDDARVLATIRGPTREDPFRFIGVKWFTKEHPNALSSIVKRRDFLIIEAMGTTYDSTGTVRLGYFIMHSVEIPRIPVLSDLDILRGRASFCFILRQVQNSSIEVFVRGFSDPQGDMLEGVSVRLAAESVLSAVKIVDFAHIKKLRWLMMNRPRNLPSIYSDSKNPTCRTCAKSVKRFSNFLQSTAATCQVCRESVCAKCTITKHVTVDISVDGATQKPLPFCLSCVMEAKDLSAWDVALEDVKQKQYSLLPEDLFPSKSAAPAAASKPVSVAEQRRDLRRVSSTPRIQRQSSASNSRMRSASHVVVQQTRRKDQDKVLLYS